MSKRRSGKRRSSKPRAKVVRKQPPIPKRSPKKGKRANTSKRAAAAKKGWQKRRKKQRLLEAMNELRRRGDQPLGWIERRSSLRSLHGGKHWIQISFDFDESARRRKHLAALADLEIDFLTKSELYDYLSWLADELDMDLSDLYRMYLGYEMGEAAE